MITAALLPWLLGFGVTLAVELPCYLLGAKALGWWADRHGGRVALVVVVINLVTHPVLWTVSRRWTTAGDLLVGELVVVVVEGVLLAVLLRGRGWTRDVGWALLLALGANAASTSVGLLVLP